MLILLLFYCFWLGSKEFEIFTKLYSLNFYIFVSELCGEFLQIWNKIVTEVLKFEHKTICNRAQVVGWPPIRSFRKNTMASNLTKNNEDNEEKSGMGCLYVKVSMDGAPYLRKVDLKTCSNYMELSLALEKMFSCFTIGNPPSLSHVRCIGT